MKLVITIEINGNPLECLFSGGKTFPYRENGTFRTIDDNVIAELEKHEQFNKQFVLIKSVKDNELPSEVIVEDTIEDNQDQEEPQNISSESTDDETEVTIEPKASDNGTIIVAEVKNSQQAKLYLNKNFNVPFSKLSNIEEVVKQTKLANLSFPNWVIK